MLKGLEGELELEGYERLTRVLLSDSSNFLKRYKGTKFDLNILKLSIISLDINNIIYSINNDINNIDKKEIKYLKSKLYLKYDEEEFNVLNIEKYNQKDIFILREIIVCSLIKTVINLTNLSKYNFEETLSDNLYCLSFELNEFFNDKFNECEIDLSSFIYNLITEMIINIYKDRYSFDDINEPNIVYNDNHFYDI